MTDEPRTEADRARPPAKVLRIKVPLRVIADTAVRMWRAILRRIT